MPSQERGELVAWCVSEAAAFDGGRIQTAASEVLQCARLGEQCVVIERNRCLQDRQLFWIAPTARAWVGLESCFGEARSGPSVGASEMLDRGAKADAPRRA